MFFERTGISIITPLTIITEIFNIIMQIFTDLLSMGAELIQWVFDWDTHPYNVVIAIGLGLFVIVMLVGMIRRFITGI